MKKILIVDDDSDVLFNLKLLLTRKGFETMAIQDGLSALILTETFLPDLVVLDVNLGDVDGREICQQLKLNEHTKNIPVMMISADINKEEVGKKCAADDFMEKPFTVLSLYSKVERLTA